MTSTGPNAPLPRLAAAAQTYVDAGWPIAPGAWWDPEQGRFRCTQSGCATEELHPTLAEAAGSSGTRCQVSATQALTRDPNTVARRWGRWPYAVLLPTGYVADVVELDEPAARRLQTVLAEYELLGPVAVIPDGRVLLFTGVGQPVDTELIAELTTAGAVHHGRGSWVPLPPSRLESGVVEWVEPEGVNHWGLLPLHTVADALRLAKPDTDREVSAEDPPRT